MIDIQEVLVSRTPKFWSRYNRTARVLSRFLQYLFYQQRFAQFEKDFPNLEGFDFVEAALRYFDFSLKLAETDRAKIPASGRVVIVANHPIGSLDGLALLHLVRQVRPDVKVVANQLLEQIKPLRSVLLPVDNMGGSTKRENVLNIRKHLESEAAIIIFPAGEVSRFGPTGVRDGAWKKGFIKFATATQSPVLPIYVAGRNSIFFYSLSFLAKPLSSAWLVREMFKHSHNRVDAMVGCAIPYENYTGGGFHFRQLARMFRKHVYRLGKNGQPIFQSIETVAPPENRALLKSEIEKGIQLGETNDRKKIYLIEATHAHCVMREIGRLRELTFRAIGEGTGKPRDNDRYDSYYKQLVLWDSDGLEIVGAYRIGETKQIVGARGVEGLYSATLFDYGPSVMPTLSQGLELGRSFVQRKYQGKQSLDYLWQGIGAFLRANPHYRYLYGPASISRFYGKEAIARIGTHYSRHFADDDLDVSPRTPFDIEANLDERFAESFGGKDQEADYDLLKSMLKKRGLTVPMLYKHYTTVAEPGGVVVKAFNIDYCFGDCVDSFFMVDLEKLKPRKRLRYLGPE